MNRTLITWLPFIAPLDGRLLLPELTNIQNRCRYFSACTALVHRRLGIPEIHNIGHVQPNSTPWNLFPIVPICRVFCTRTSEGSLVPTAGGHRIAISRPGFKDSARIMPTSPSLERHRRQKTVAPGTGLGGAFNSIGGKTNGILSLRKRVLLNGLLLCTSWIGRLEIIKKMPMYFSPNFNCPTN